MDKVKGGVGSSGQGGGKRGEYSAHTNRGGLPSPVTPPSPMSPAFSWRVGHELPAALRQPLFPATVAEATAAASYWTAESRSALPGQSAAAAANGVVETHNWYSYGQQSACYRLSAKPWIMNPLNLNVTLQP